MRFALRHFVSVGKRSIAVVIPKKWVSALCISAGGKAILRLNNDGSITIYPQTKTASQELGERKASQPINIGQGLADKRLYLKEILSLCVTGPSSSCIKSLGSSAHLYFLDREPVDVALDIAGGALQALRDFLHSMNDLDASRVHDLEDKMDLVYYSSYRSTARRLLASLKRGISAREAIAWIASMVLIKTSEDLVDSIDRLVWRIKETGTLSRDVAGIIDSICSIFDNISSCINNKCELSDIEAVFREIKIVRQSLRRNIANYPQPLAPVVAEIETIINILENFVEIALIKAIGNTR